MSKSGVVILGISVVDLAFRAEAPTDAAFINVLGLPAVQGGMSNRLSSDHVDGCRPGVAIRI